MKKLSKTLALSLALALTLSMTVFAADSANPEKEYADAAQGSTATVVDADGKAVTGAVEVQVTEVTESKATKSALEAAVKKADDELTVAIKTAAKLDNIQTPELLTTIEIDVLVGGTEMTSGSTATVTVKCPGLKKEAGYKYVLMHFDGTKWEAVSNVEIGDGTFTFTSGSFSPYALFRVKEDTSNKDNGGSNGGGTTTMQAPASEPVSPKTGESVPAAGFAALILLAGAAVCAKKVQFHH